MKEINVDVLKVCANKLLFDMDDDQFIKLNNELKDIIAEMEIIGKNVEVDALAPMIYPFDVYTTELREDVASTPLKREDALKNAKNIVAGQIKIGKVVS